MDENKIESDVPCCKKCHFVQKRMEPIARRNSDYTTVEAFYCRRFPPVFEGIIRVSHDGWCGEWTEEKNILVE